MKKLIAFALVLCMLLTMAACAPTGSPNETNAPTNGNAISGTDADTEAATSGGIDTDENFLTVDITLPASMFSDEDMTAFDADAYAEEEGFIKAVLNADGSVTVTMTKLKHNELLKEMTDSLEESFDELVEAEETPYIKEISYNDDFSAVTVKVDRAGYESAVFEMTPFIVGMSAMIYQAFLDMEPVCVVTIVDVETGDTLNSVTYPVAEE